MLLCTKLVNRNIKINESFPSKSYLGPYFKIISFASLFLFTTLFKCHYYLVTSNLSYITLKLYHI